MPLKQFRLMETRAATLELVSNALIELRFKPDVKLNAECMAEVIHAKRTLIANRTVDVLAVFPENLDFELSLLNIDHHAVNHGCGGAHRLALAAQSTFNKRLSDIYFRYHPRPHPTGVFATEADARKWLAAKVFASAP